MAGDGRIFEYENHHKLDSPERHRSQPPAPLVDLVLTGGPSVVADIGVGTGYFAVPIAERMDGGGGVVLGVDPDTRMLEVLAERAAAVGVGDRIRTVPMPERDRLPLGDGAVDVALLSSLYHELDDRPAYLREVARALCPGGAVVLCDWHPEGTSERGPRPHHRVRPEVAAAELREAGLVAPTAHELYDDFWVLRAERPAVR
jgi:SAM-dependent methyltransferase